MADLAATYRTMADLARRYAPAEIKAQALIVAGVTDDLGKIAEAGTLPSPGAGHTPENQQAFADVFRWTETNCP